jgi:hypothetical protein
MGLVQLWSPIQEAGLAFGGIDASDVALWWTLRRMLYTGIVLIILVLEVLLIRKVVQHRRIAKRNMAGQ